MNEVTQFFLEEAFEIGDDEMTDIVCEDCAINFANEHKLEWVGGKAIYSYTLINQDTNAYAACLGLEYGESDYPHSCCGWYLKTRFTPDGLEHLKAEFPQWVQDLYLKD